MKRTVVQTPVNEQTNRYEVTITSDVCEPQTFHARKVALDLLYDMAHTPGLVDCGANAFQELKMRHDGEKWMVVLEAVGP